MFDKAENRSKFKYPRQFIAFKHDKSITDIICSNHLPVVVCLYKT